MTAAGGGSPPPSPTRPRRYAGQTEAERVADRRRRLLDSGFALFGTEGLHLVSITRLCRHAGLTEHHFYAAFGTKAALLAAVYEEQVAGITQVAADALAEAPPDTEGRIGAIVAAAARHLLDDPRRARIVTVEIAASPDLEGQRRQAGAGLAELIRLLAVELRQADPSVNDEPNEFINRGLVAAFNDAVLHQLDADATESVDDLIAELTQLFVAAARIPGRASWPTSRP